MFLVRGGYDSFDVWNEEKKAPQINGLIWLLMLPVLAVLIYLKNNILVGKFLYPLSNHSNDA
jgi:hypothetical protein